MPASAAPLPADPSVVILGAGAAGLGAARELAERGVSFVILEAADRVGGRAFTDAASLPAPWDHGCGWLHSADVNPLRAEAERLGAGILRQSRFDAVMLHQGGAWLPPETVHEARAALDAAFEAFEAAGRAGEDRANAGLLDPASPWLRAIRLILALVEAEEPERVSCAGAWDYVNTGVDWPLVDGYGALVARLAEGLPIRLSTPATRVAEEGRGVRVETPAGALRADAAIVTASTGVLLSGGIEIGPGPAREALDLMQAVPCGAYEKVAVALRALPVDDPNKLFLSILPDAAEALHFQVQRPTRPGRAPLMIAHLGGDQARAMAAEGPEAMKALAVETLAHGFGAGIRKEVLGSAVTGWQKNPWTRGAYSHLALGGAADRARLVELDAGPIAFAGEALSIDAQGTCHGAWTSGRKAAARLAKALAPA